MDTKQKLTAEQIADWEKDNMIDAVCSGCIELNDEFLTRYCGEELKSLLLPLDPWTRTPVVREAIDNDNSYWAGYYLSLSGNEIFINDPEIETQINSPDELENPDDFVIDKNGDSYLAYSCPGYGVVIPVNLERLQAAIIEEEN